MVQGFWWHHLKKLRNQLLFLFVGGAGCRLVMKVRGMQNNKATVLEDGRFDWDK
jgi:hypothetical protein